MVTVFKPGEIRFQDAEHGGFVGGVELTRLAVAALAELDDAEVAEVNLTRIDGC